VQAGTLEGKVYQGAKLGGAIPAKDNGSFSLKKGKPGVAATATATGGGAEIWVGNLEFGVGESKTAFDQYAVELLESGGGGSGFGVHSIGSSKGANGSSKGANVHDAELLNVVVSADSIKWADSESLMVGKMDSGGLVIEGKMYQGKQLADDVTDSTPHQGVFKLAKAEPSSHLDVYGAVQNRLRTENKEEADIACKEDELTDDVACQLLCTDSACTKATK
jgi:hypothetical protein